MFSAVAFAVCCERVRGRAARAVWLVRVQKQQERRRREVEWGIGLIVGMEWKGIAWSGAAMQ